MADTKYESTPSEPPPSYETASKPVVPAGAPARPRVPLPLDLPSLNMLKGKRVVLASASPRRRQLLAQIGLTNIQIIPSTVPEAFPKSLAPFEYVLETATQKAMTVYQQEINNPALDEPALVIAADTIVVSHLGVIMEKPRSEQEHVAMLKTLRDDPLHKVFTAVVVMAPLESAKAPGYALETCTEETLVRFDHNVTDDLIMAYVKTREGADKAGGYGIQGMGTLLIERIEGSFDNVVGLPLRATLQMIEKVLVRGDDIDEDFGEPEEED